MYAGKTTLVDLLHRRRRAALCRLDAHCQPSTQQTARTTLTTIRICRGEAIFIRTERASLPMACGRECTADLMACIREFADRSVATIHTLATVKFESVIHRLHFHAARSSPPPRRAVAERTA